MKDMLDISTLQIHAAPDVRSWPATVRIQGLEWRPGPSEGLRFDCEGLDRWPDYTPPGWDGPIQYTVWLVVRVAGHWHASGIIQMWRRNTSNRSHKDNGWTGAPPFRYYREWIYDTRWGVMQAFVPTPGATVGFFLTAGNARQGSAPGEGAITSLAERSNIITVQMPANDFGTFAFPNSPGPAPGPEPEPTPTPTPTPTPNPTPVPTPDQKIADTLTAVTIQLESVITMLERLIDRPDPIYDARYIGEIRPRPRTKL